MSGAATSNKRTLMNMRRRIVEDTVVGTVGNLEQIATANLGYN